MKDCKPCPFTKLAEKRKQNKQLKKQMAEEAETDPQLSIPSASEWFKSGSRVNYDPTRKRIMDRVTPASLKVWKRVVCPFEDSTNPRTRWLTLAGGIPDGTYSFAKLDPLLQTAPRLYVEYVGMGDSDKPNKYPHSVYDQANLIEAQWRSHKVRRTVLVVLGNSANVMMELLMRQRERLSLGLPLRTRIEHVLSINGGYFADGHKPCPLNTNPFISRTVGKATMKLAEQSTAVLDTIMRSCFSKGYNVTKTELRAFQDVVKKRRGMNLFWSDMMRYVQEHKQHADRWNLVNIYRLTRRQGISFTIVGAEDDHFEAKSYALARKRLGQEEEAYFETVPGGHHTASEQPFRVAQLIDAVAMAPAFDEALSFEGYPSKRSSIGDSENGTISTATSSSSRFDPASTSSIFDAEYPDEFEFPF